MMASRRGKGSAARNAPFGTDIQPKRNIKIIGGKQIEIAVDSPPTSASTLRSLPPLQQGPNGTPPMEVQPPYQEYNNNIKLEYPEKQLKKERIIYSQTAPADKSNSHIHGTRGRNHSLPAIHAVLPPIPSPNSLSPSQDSWNRSRSPSPTLLNQPEVSLTEQLKDLFKEYDPYRFQDMYKDLAEYDRKLSGFVSQPQVNMIALKHQLPIPTNMMRLLFSNFCKDDNVDMVNYEKLIQYLARAQLGTAEAETLLQESVNRFVNAPDNPPADEVDLDDQIAKYETTAKDNNHRHRHQQKQQLREQRASPRDMRQIQLEKNSRQAGGHDQMQSLGLENEPQILAKRPQKVFSDREDAKLLMLLEQQYIQGNQDPTDLHAMKKDFMERDTRGHGTLSKEKIQEVCFKHRIPLQGSLMDKLMQRCDTGEDQHSWVAFLEFLGRVKPLAPQASTLNSDVARPSTWPRQGGDGGQKTITKSGSPSVPQEPAPPPWETRKPLGRLGIKSPTTVEREITLYDSPSPPPLDSGPPAAHIRVDHGNSDQAELAVLAQEHRQKRHQAMMAAKVPVKVKEDQPWFTRFKHLAKGLYNLDSTNKGYLSKEETVGLVNNYNLIYRLELQQSQIDRCIASCSYAKGQVSIEHLLEALRLCVQ